ncbi:MAG: acetylornithine deacetylase [Paracoccaceae bacterium]
MRSIEILERLIAFPTISRDPNIELIDYARGLLADHGVESTLIPDQNGTKANLYATIGPKDRPGVMLSGHTDVVPVEGQAWSTDPFQLVERGGRLFGRGAADMKGFVAAALAAAGRASGRELKTPLHLALSYDEEVGCLGVRSLIDMLAAAPHRPAFAIVGEPTTMQVATGHKGKRGLRATCIGREGHSALAPMALNALHLAADFIAAVRARQALIVAEGARDGDYDIPYTTLHVGRVVGGVALNIVPNLAVVDFEIRHLAGDDAGAIIAGLAAEADAIAAATGEPEAAIRIETVMEYPGLDTAPDAAITAFVKSLTGANGAIKVAYGTEGGLFSARLGVPAIVCGPGSMAQGHKPDEFVSREQMMKCDAMLDALIDRLESGL